MVRLLLLLLLPGLSDPVVAQIPAYEFLGEAAGDSFGSSLANAGDVDGDGHDDLIIGAPGADAGGPNFGSAFVYSGRTGEELHRFHGSSIGERFGFAVSGAGDVNNDGHDDLIIGAPRSSVAAFYGGAATVYSGADGTILRSFYGTHQFGHFGSAVAAAGNVDGDLYADVVVGAPLEDSSGVDAGSVYVYSGASGQVWQSFAGDQPYDQLGFSVAGAGDVDLDGRDDVLAGAPKSGAGGHWAGMVRAWSGSSGMPLHTLFGAANDEELGHSVAVLGDLSGDGHSEFAAGAPGALPGGRLVVHSGSDGDLLFELLGVAEEALGTSVARVLDQTGDGFPELIVGAPSATGYGSARVHSGADGDHLSTVLADQQGSNFGVAVSGGFDLNDDGFGEIAVGAPNHTAPLASQGAVRSWSPRSFVGQPFCFGDGSGATCPCGNFSSAEEGCLNSVGRGAVIEASGSASVGADNLGFHVRGVPSAQPVLMFTGVSRISGGQGSSIYDGLLCTSGSVVRLDVRFAAQEEATWEPGQTGLWEFQPGETRSFQVWFRDPRYGPCGTGANFSNAIEIQFGF